MITMSRAQYSRVRSDDTWFAVLPDHVLQASERTVEDLGSHWIIEKLDEGGRRAEELAVNDGDAS